jgi:hypothetical protein
VRVFESDGTDSRLLDSATVSVSTPAI